MKLNKKAIASLKSAKPRGELRKKRAIASFELMLILDILKQVLFIILLHIKNLIDL